MHGDRFTNLEGQPMVARESLSAHGDELAASLSKRLEEAHISIERLEAELSDWRAVRDLCIHGLDGRSAKVASH